MKVGKDGTTEEDIHAPTTITTNITIFDWEAYERNQTIIAFYQTYDVMTGVRIAATLGGFFGLMVILVLYKSKSKTEKALEDPNFTAAAVAEVEEEDERQLAATILEQTNLYQQLNPRKSRRSLDISNMSSSSTGWIKQATRFSSVGSGGYSNLMEPPIRTHSRLPCFIDEDTPPEEDRSLYDDIYYNRHLDVPRRSSNITCSSSGSSYLERRDSSVAIGMPPLSDHKSSSRNPRRLSSPLLEIYDFYYPIDIKVIQPTPGGSPCGSDRALYDNINQPSPSIINNHNYNHNNNNTNLHQRLAPLASISSCNSSLGTDNPDIELTSYDSVFHDKDDDDSDDDDDDNHDTDDEIESFSTDSEIATNDCYNCKKRDFNESLTPVNEQQSFQSSKSTLTLIDNNRIVNEGIATTSSIDLDEKRPQETLF